MSLLDKIHQLNNVDLNEYRPLLLDDDVVGLIWQANLERLRSNGMVLYDDGSALIWQAPTDFAERNAILAQLAQTLYHNGYINGWRDERLPLLANLHRPVRALIERAAAPVLGICGYGVHLNGITERHGKMHLWVARRAANKPVEPNKLDQIAAGGIPYGIGIFANLIKESNEEAGIPESLVCQAKAVGTISYMTQTENGIRADLLYNYDLYLPADFQPYNRDGEVSEFLCLPVEEVAQIVADSDAFKLNSSVVVIDFLIRHGYLNPDTPDYTRLCRQIHQHHPQMQP